MKKALKVLEKSRVVEYPRHMMVKQGDSFELECAISTDPELLSSLLISWRQNKMEVAVAGPAALAAAALLAVCPASCCGPFCQGWLADSS